MAIHQINFYTNCSKQKDSFCEVLIFADTSEEILDLTSNLNMKQCCRKRSIVSRIFGMNTGSSIDQPFWSRKYGKICRGHFICNKQSYLFLKMNFLNQVQIKEADLKETFRILQEKLKTEKTFN